MSRILVYSHDTYGLGNIRRMLAIAVDLAGAIDDASVLVLSGSPILQAFRIPSHVDYIKLPSITRTARDGYAARSLHLEVDDVLELRANLALAAVADFRPDVILVDKKPYGVRNELEGAILYAKTHLPGTALVLVLRDILDEPAVTMRMWRREGYTATIERFFDRVLVLGTPGIFDMRREYDLPGSVCDKLRFCGYIRRPRGARERSQVRRELGLTDYGRLVLVTPGGGQDGDRIAQTYADALPAIHARPGVRSLIVTGPEMAAVHRQAVSQAAHKVDGASVLEFTDDMMSWMDAADLVVCMGGYNTLCEVATLRKRAIVVPRVHPVEEQAIRAECLARAGVVQVVRPEDFGADHLVSVVHAQLRSDLESLPASLDLTALPRVTRHVRALLRQRRSAGPTTRTVARTRSSASATPAPLWVA